MHAYVIYESLANRSYRTDIHIMASTFLLPVGVVLYTLVGGIKATFVPTVSEEIWIVQLTALSNAGF